MSRAIVSLVGGLVCLLATSVTGQAPDPAVSRAMGLLHDVCLVAWPDFADADEAAMEQGLQDWSSNDEEVWGDQGTGVSVSIVPAETLVFMQIFPAQCVVTVLNTPFAQVRRGLDRHGVTLGGKSLALTEGRNGDEASTRTYGAPNDQQVHMLLLDLPADNAVGMAVAPQSYH